MQGDREQSDVRYRRGGGLRVILIGAISAFVLSSSCTLDTGVTRCEISGLNCPEGWVCSAEQDVCIRAGTCGNNIVSDGEVCDDGNNQGRDGCSSDCKSDESCGNDILDVAVGEICDDGGRVDGDGCSADCESEACGNRVVDVGAREECDTGPGDSFGCNFDCSFRRCGDGYVNKMAEDCEVADSQPTNDCDGDCTSPTCGDKYINPNFFVFRPSATDPPGTEPQTEQCDTGVNTESCNGNDNDNALKMGLGDCQKPECGDGYHNPKFEVPRLERFEECDEGENKQGCNGDDNDNDVKKGLGNCQIPECGDSYFNPGFTPMGSTKAEQCDDGENTHECNGTDKATTDAGNCQTPACGDGYVNKAFSPSGKGGPVEQCDEGAADSPKCNGNGPGPDTAKCRDATCGDGYVNTAFKPGPDDGEGAPEVCDTGGNTPADPSRPACNGDDNANGKGNCQVSVCGDGYINSADGEDCDNGTPDPNVPCGERRCVSCVCVDP